MKWFSGCMLLFAITFSVVSKAEDVDQQKAVSVDGLVKIKNLRGELNVVGWDQALVKVTGELDELAEGLRFEVLGDVTEIEVIMPTQNVNWGDGSDLQVYVPHASRLAVSSVATDVEIESVHGGVQVRTVSGEIVLEDGRNAISLKSVSGDIETSKTAARLSVQSSSGDIIVDQHVGNLDLESISGLVKARAAEVSRMRANTVSADIEITVGFLGDISAELTSVSGHVEVSVIDPVDLMLRVSSNSGNIDNSLTKDKATSEYGMKSLQGKVGSGAGTLAIRTVSGNIELEEG